MFLNSLNFVTKIVIVKEIHENLNLKDLGLEKMGGCSEHKFVIFS